MSESFKKSPQDKTPKGLGRGLAALIPNLREAPVVPQIKAPNADKAGGGEEVVYLPVKRIRPNPFQPRRQWNQEKLNELADSIRNSGLLQPLLVRPVDGDGKPLANVGDKPADQVYYEVIAGERRLRALEVAGLSQAPAIVRAVDNRASLELAIVENIQREDLNPVDEAMAYERLMKEFQYSQQDLSQRVGKDRSTVANSLRLLSLSQDILTWISAGELTPGHARAVLSLKTDDDRMSLAHLIRAKGLSVREAERLAREDRERKTPQSVSKSINPQIRFQEDALMSKLGTKVKIRHRGKRGRIEIEYYSMEDLNRLIDLLKK